MIGLVTGTLAGLLGVGGGIVMVPAMILLFHIQPVITKGTSATVIIPAALMGPGATGPTRNADLRAAAVLGVAGIVTAALGAIVSDRMSDTVSNVLLTTLLILVTARRAWVYGASRRRHATSNHTSPERPARWVTVGNPPLNHGKFWPQATTMCSDAPREITCPDGFGQCLSAPALVATPPIDLANAAPPGGWHVFVYIVNDSEGQLPYGQDIDEMLAASQTGIDFTVYLDSSDTAGRATSRTPSPTRTTP